jgi:hypothetical protein
MISTLTLQGQFYRGQIRTHYKKRKFQGWGGGMAQVVENLPSKCKANLSTAGGRENKTNKRNICKYP